MINRTAIVVPLFGLSLVVSASPKPGCPAAVTEAALKPNPGAKVTACKPEKVDGHDQYEVKIVTAQGKKLEMDVDSAGAILLTEEPIGVDEVPAQVRSAFEAKYPKAKASGAEKQTRPDGKVSYELAFQQAGKRREATFSAEGTFLEEE